MVSILSNSASATASFSPARRRGREKTGGPSVGTTCSTPWRGGLLSNLDTKISGKESSSASISLRGVETGKADKLLVLDVHKKSHPSKEVRAQDGERDVRQTERVGQGQRGELKLD